MEGNSQFILVLEDDPTIQYVWETLLRDIGANLEVKSFSRFEDAENFLAFRSAEKCRGIISDFYLGGRMNGLDFFDLHRAANLPFLLATGLNEEELKQIAPSRENWPIFVSKTSGINEMLLAAQALLENQIV